jgi:hypothetical protein
MAQIVLGLGVSHSPQVSTPADLWHLRGERDRNDPNLDFARLERERRPLVEHLINAEVFEQKDQKVQAAVAHLKAELARVSPDVVLVIGDDQDELFLDDRRALITIFWGDHLVDIPTPLEQLPENLRPAAWARHAEVEEKYPCHPRLAEWLIKSLVEQDFDIEQLHEQPEGRGLGHAFTFPRLRLMGNTIIPMVPVFLNTYFGPNQPSARRSFHLGRALRFAVESFSGNERVAVIASGGLSHFVVDEEFDRGLLDALDRSDEYAISQIPREKLQSGTSECNNWIAAGGSLTHLKMELIDYVPGYRSLAGTGCGMAFAKWLPAE